MERKSLKEENELKSLLTGYLLENNLKGLENFCLEKGSFEDLHLTCKIQNTFTIEDKIFPSLPPKELQKLLSYTETDFTWPLLFFVFLLPNVHKDVMKFVIQNDNKNINYQNERISMKWFLSFYPEKFDKEILTLLYEKKAKHVDLPFLTYKNSVKGNFKLLQNGDMIINYSLYNSNFDKLADTEDFFFIESLPNNLYIVIKKYHEKKMGFFNIIDFKSNKTQNFYIKSSDLSYAPAGVKYLGLFGKKILMYTTNLFSFAPNKVYELDIDKCEIKLISTESPYDVGVGFYNDEIYLFQFLNPNSITVKTISNHQVSSFEVGYCESKSILSVLIIENFIFILTTKHFLSIHKNTKKLSFLKHRSVLKVNTSLETLKKINENVFISSFDSCLRFWRKTKDDIFNEIELQIPTILPSKSLEIQYSPLLSYIYVTDYHQITYIYHFHSYHEFQNVNLTKLNNISFSFE